MGELRRCLLAWRSPHSSWARPSSFSCPSSRPPGALHTRASEARHGGRRGASRAFTQKQTPRFLRRQDDAFREYGHTHDHYARRRVAHPHLRPSVTMTAATTRHNRVITQLLRLALRDGLSRPSLISHASFSSSPARTRTSCSPTASGRATDARRTSAPGRGARGTLSHHHHQRGPDLLARPLLLRCCPSPPAARAPHHANKQTALLLLVLVLLGGARPSMRSCPTTAQPCHPRRKEQVEKHAEAAMPRLGAPAAMAVGRPGGAGGVRGGMARMIVCRRLDRAPPLGMTSWSASCLTRSPHAHTP